MAGKTKDNAKDKDKGGRPPVFDQEAQELIKAEILDWIVCGNSMSAYVKQEGKPSYSLVCRWLREDTEFVQNYARAREEQADTLADQIIEIADEPLPVDSSGRIDPGAVAEKRLRVDSRKWAASKLKPKKYGDRQQIDQNISGGLTFSEALKALDES